MKQFLYNHLCYICMRNSIPNVKWSQMGSLTVAKVAALLILAGKIIVDLIYCNLLSAIIKNEPVCKMFLLITCG